MRYMLTSVTEITDYCSALESEALSSANTASELHQAIVDAPFRDHSKVVSLDLGIVVLLLVNNQTETIDRIALANTEMAKGAVDMSVKKFNEIKIPIGYSENIIAKAIETRSPQRTEDWKELFVPDLTPQQARFNQAGAGIECSVVYPLNISDGGAIIFSYYQPSRNIAVLHDAFMEEYTQKVSKSLGRFEAQPL